MRAAPRRKQQAVGIFSLILAVLSLGSHATASPKKDDVKRRLRSLDQIHVEGTGRVAAYVSRNLVEETCLKRALSEENADAILEVWQRPAPCRSSQFRICVEVSMKLIDRETKKVLYYRSDSEFGSALSLNVEEAAGQWVLWNLRAACCKDR
jgi:hypothetical protein